MGYFGSYARGDYVPGSDFDVLIEVCALQADDGALRPSDRPDRYLPDDFPVAIQIVVYTSAELAKLRRGGFAFIATVDKEVLWLS